MARRHAGQGHDRPRPRRIAHPLRSAERARLVEGHIYGLLGMLGHVGHLGRTGETGRMHMERAPLRPVDRFASAVLDTAPAAGRSSTGLAELSRTSRAGQRASR